MKEIFSLQWDFNELALRNIGLDYRTTIRAPESIPPWIENYRIALSAELAELLREVREFGTETHNGKIEIVDMLHFLVSLSHIVDIDPSETVAFFTPGNQADRTETAFYSITIDFFLALDDLQNSRKWKWWAKGGGYKPDRAKEAVFSIWKCFGKVCAVYGLDFAAIKKIYIAKNELNFKRQAQNYNEDTKNESDNTALKL